jgi:hypothetical protein
MERTILQSEKEKMFWKLIFAVSFIATPPIKLDFTNLKDEAQNGQKVQISGFAYQAKNGQWILSPDPQLKSCCIGSVAKAQQQIVLEGTFFSLPPAKALIIEGDLVIDSSQSIGYYSLYDIKILNDSSTPWKTISVLAGISIIASGAYIFNYKKNKN